MGNLAWVKREQGDFAAARALEEQLLDARRLLLAEEHPDVLSAMHNLATTMQAQGDLPGAQALQAHVVAARRRLLGDAHPDTLQSMHGRARLAAMVERWTGQAARALAVE